MADGAPERRAMTDETVHALLHANDQSYQVPEWATAGGDVIETLGKLDAAGYFSGGHR